MKKTRRTFSPEFRLESAQLVVAHNDGVPPAMAEQQYWNAQKTVAKMT